MCQGQPQGNSRKGPCILQMARPKGSGSQAHWSSHNDTYVPDVGHEVIEFNVSLPGF